MRSCPMQSTTSSTKRNGIQLAATLTKLIAFQISRYTARLDYRAELIDAVNPGCSSFTARNGKPMQLGPIWSFS